MKIYYAVSEVGEWQTYRDFARRHEEKIEAWLRQLRDEFSLKEPPEMLILANEEMACRAISPIPLPAYTNDFRVVFTPELSVWNRIYAEQLKPYPEEEARVKILRTRYAEQTDERVLLQLIGHELAHHIDLFLEPQEESDDGMWFEEGMAEYLSRRAFFDEELYLLEKESNRLLLELCEETFGPISVEEFTRSTYQKSKSEIFAAYWKSFFTVEALVEREGGIDELFARYHAWDRDGRRCTLSAWLDTQSLIFK